MIILTSFRLKIYPTKHLVTILLYFAKIPQSTDQLHPVTFRAASEASSTRVGAISSGSLILLIQQPSSNSCFTTGFSNHGTDIGVLIGPGHRVTTLMLYSPNSIAKAWDMMNVPPLLAQYTDSPAAPTCDTSDPILIMTPVLRGIMCCAANLQAKK